MSYVVKSLDELAAQFLQRAKDAIEAGRLAHTDRIAILWEGQAVAWESAAYILRHTTITEDITCREI